MATTTYFVGDYGMEPILLSKQTIMNRYDVMRGYMLKDELLARFHKQIQYEMVGDGAYIVEYKPMLKFGQQTIIKTHMRIF